MLCENKWINFLQQYHYSYGKKEHILCPYWLPNRWRTLVCILPTRLHYCLYTKCIHGHWGKCFGDRFICSGLWPADFPNLNLSDTGNKTAKRLHIKPQCNWKTEEKHKKAISLCTPKAFECRTTRKFPASSTVLASFICNVFRLHDCPFASSLNLHRICLTEGASNSPIWEVQCFVECLIKSHCGKCGVICDGNYRTVVEKQWCRQLVFSLTYLSSPTIMMGSLWLNAMRVNLFRFLFTTACTHMGLYLFTFKSKTWTFPSFVTAANTVLE